LSNHVKKRAELIGMRRFHTENRFAEREREDWTFEKIIGSLDQ
jgi:hypothetical protein